MMGSCQKLVLWVIVIAVILGMLLTFIPGFW